MWTGPVTAVPKSVLDLRNVVYKFTSPSGKSYVGQTVHFEQRFKKYRSLRKRDIGPAFYNALAKHGFVRFTLAILGTYASRALLDRAEILAIWKEKTLRPGGYNLNAGGGSAAPTEDTKKKMSERARNRTDQTRKNMSDAGKRRWAQMTAEQRENASLTLKKGRAEMTTEQRENVTLAAKKRWAEMTTEQRDACIRRGERNHWYGKPKSLEWKLKFKASNKKIPCDVDLPLYVSLLRHKDPEREPIVRVMKPGHRPRSFGSIDPLSERVEDAIAYLNGLD